MGREREEFREVFEELFTRARALARRILGDEATAEDVAAEALARTFARWPRMKGAAHLEFWVLRVAGNLAVDAARKRGRSVVTMEAAPASETATLRLALAAALRSLPRRQREVLVLHYLSDLTEEEVATALGIAQGTVHTHLHRGLTALRARLGADFREDSLYAT